MSLRFIHATFECEGCGESFDVCLANDASTRETLYEVALEFLHNRNGRGQTMPSYIAQVVLCTACTSKIDAACLKMGIRDYDELTREWVLHHLGSFDTSLRDSMDPKTRALARRTQ